MRLTNNPFVLSPRLQVVHDMISPGSLVADIGCDHGYLSIALINSGQSPRVIACDASRHAIRRAEANIALHAQYNDRSQLETRLSDGLMALQPGEVEEISMTGLGVKKMISIVQAAQPEMLGSVRAFVLQPYQPRLKLMLSLRQTLWHHGFAVQHESYLQDLNRQHYLSLRVARIDATARGVAELPCERELLLGPDESVRQHPVTAFVSYLQQQREVVEQEAMGMQRGLTRSALGTDEVLRSTGGASAALSTSDTGRWAEVQALEQHNRWLSIIDDQIRWCAR
jgi:tRNA (adenine22-N1)-methyltransferase